MVKMVALEKNIPSNRFIPSTSIFITGQLSPLLIPFVLDSDLGSGIKTALPGFLMLGVPELAIQLSIVIMEKAGFVNYALGKWDHAPRYEVSENGPFDRWPSGKGLDHYYGFMAADADCYLSLVWRDHYPIEDWEGKPQYHYMEAMADKAIQNITSHITTAPDKPFVMFWAPVVMHSPHRAPQDYIDKYKGKFDMSWDKAREIIHAKQLEMGFIPQGTKLTERTKEIPAWVDLEPVEQKLYARQMEVFAAMLDHVDEQIGRMFELLEETGHFDNTIIFVRADNAEAPSNHPEQYYDYNYYNGLYYTLESTNLGTGEVHINFDFTEKGSSKSGIPGGVGTMYINGDKVDETTLEEMHISTFSLSKTFDVGVDAGTPVSNKHKIKNHFPYPGELDKVIIRLTE
jgi:arylsulfatase A-like enzyme